MTDRERLPAKEVQMNHQETRPILYLTYAHDGLDAPVLDVSGSLEEARRNVRAGAWKGYCWRVVRDPDGSYRDDALVEVIKPKDQL